MKRTALLGNLFAALFLPFAAAHAHSDVSVSVSTPEFGIRIGGPVYRPAPVVVVPAPVYAPGPMYAPAPVYAPPPAYFVPRPVYVAPRVVYPAPVVIVAPRHAARPYGPGAWVAPRHTRYRHGDDDRHERREHRRDRYQHGAGYGF